MDWQNLGGQKPSHKWEEEITGKIRENTHCGKHHETYGIGILKDMQKYIKSTCKIWKRGGKYDR